MGSHAYSHEKLRKTCLEWVEVMDTDQSGSIEFHEFYHFFANFDELPLGDVAIDSMFKYFDASKDKKITVDEFAKGIEKACKEYHEHSGHHHAHDLCSDQVDLYEDVDKADESTKMLGN